MKKREWIFVYVFLLILVVIVLIPISPHINPFPKRDSGVFMYMGNLILDGGIPYRDAWDHKGPVIFYINALAFLLKRNSFWGIWIIEIISLYFAALLGFKLIKTTFGKLPALFGSILWILGITLVLDGGNFTEEFALPLQMASAVLIFQLLKNKNEPWKSFIIGVLAGISFLLRPNIIGVPISIGIVLIYQLFNNKNKLPTIKNLTAIFTGFSITLAIVFYYFYLNGAFADMWQAMITFNINYSKISIDSQSFSTRYSTFIKGLELLPSLTTVGYTGWVLGIIYFIKTKNTEEKNRVFILFLLIWLPVEIILSLTSGRNYPHYFINLLPVLGLLSGFFAFRGINYFSEHNSVMGKKNAKIFLIIMLISLILAQTLKLFPASIKFTKSAISNTGLPTVNPIKGELIKYLNDFLTEDEYLYMWGNELSYNVVLGNRAPSKFIYIAPLISIGCEDSSMVSEFLSDIQEKKPVIVDTVYFNSISFGERDWNCKEMQIVRDYVFENYEIVTTIDQKSIYQHKSE